MGVELATREPSSLVEVNDQCQAIEAWAAECASIPELQDANNRLAAIDEYLARTSKDGRARVAATMRRLELRIGDLLGPDCGHGGDRSEGASPHADLPKQRAQEFRRFAAHRDIVEATIALATDKAPPYRRTVIRAIAEANQAEAIAMQVAGVTQADIAKHFGVAQTTVSNWLIGTRSAERTPRSEFHRNSHHIQARRVVEQTYYALDGLAMGLKQADLQQLDPGSAKEWADHLSDALRPIQAFIRDLDRRSREQS